MKVKKQLYWPPAVTVDTVIFTIENNLLKVLLIKRANQPYQNSWALPGGFLLKSETTHHAALRTLKEKAGISSVYVEQLYTFDSPGRDPRGHVLTVTYFTLVPREEIQLAKGKDFQEPTFYPIKKLPQLAFDHEDIVRYATKRLQAKLEYTNVIFSLLPRYFSLYQLQRSYEIILDRKLDKRNFIKKYLSLGLIKPTTKKFTGGRQRPARLYQFASRTPAELKKFF